jgi:hypothetical protein
MFGKMLKILRPKKTFNMFGKKCPNCIYVAKKTYEMIRELNIDSREDFAESVFDSFSRQYKKYYVNKYQKCISLVDFYYLIESLLYYWDDKSARVYDGEDVAKPVPGVDLSPGINYALVDENYHTQCVGEIEDKKNKVFQCRPNNVADAESLDKIIKTKWDEPIFFECPFDKEYLKKNRICTRKLH